MNTRSTTQQVRMGKYSTSHASDDHAQAPYQLAHFPVLSYWELVSTPQSLEDSLEETDQLNLNLN